MASYRDRAGASQVTVELPESATVAQLAAELLRRYPKLTKDAAGIVVAVNQEYRDHAHVLSDGDEAALIPPVSGGAL